jgi:hypothetical protein
MNGAQRDLGLAGQLRLRHEPILAQLTYSIRALPSVAHVAFPQSSRGSACWQLPGISDDMGISLEKIRAWRLTGESGEHLQEDQGSRGDAASPAYSRPLFEPKLHVSDVQLPSVEILAGAARRALATCPPIPEGGARRGSCGAH